MASSRFDIYVKIHKALRKGLFELALAAGNTNYNDQAQVHRLVSLFDDVFAMLNEHGRNEDTYFLPLIEAKVPGSTARDAEEHHRIEMVVQDLIREKELLAAAPPEERLPRGEAFYHSINTFIADYLMHMKEEEVSTTTIFYKHCTDAELQDAFRLMMSNMKHESLQRAFRYMFPAINDEERIAVVRGAKVASPNGVAGLMKIAGAVLPEREYEAIVAATV